jgi:hypothetical protein
VDGYQHLDTVVAITLRASFLLVVALSAATTALVRFWF